MAETLSPKSRESAGRGLENLLAKEPWNGLPITSLLIQQGNRFYYCRSLTNATIGNGVTSIGDGAFAYCTSLTNVTIGNGVTTIEDFAFNGCNNMLGACFKGNAPSVGSYVFASGNNATVYYLPGTTGWGPTYSGRPTALWHLPVADASATEPLLLSANGINATAVLNGSRSCDLDGDTLQYSWFSSSCQPPTLLATGVVAVTVLPVGSHALDLVVSDGVATSTNSISVAVLTMKGSRACGLTRWQARFGVPRRPVSRGAPMRIARAGAACPDCMTGLLVSKTMKDTGKAFVGCNRFPACKFFAWPEK